MGAYHFHDSALTVLTVDGTVRAVTGRKPFSVGDPHIHTEKKNTNNDKNTVYRVAINRQISMRVACTGAMPQQLQMPYTSQNQRTSANTT